jgi:phosphoenolpyruvate carboxylase
MTPSTPITPSTLVISQNADVRFLGKLLGDVIREYGGEALFRRIEYIRATSVDRYRGVAEVRGVEPGLDALSLDETIAFVRSFMLFSMLANLAEDLHGSQAEQGDDLAAALRRMAAIGIGVQQAVALLNRALIVPVLTAHPTEVMRKSMLDHRNRIAVMMRLRDAGRTETAEGELIEHAIARQIALLWQTRALRRERLYVTDEVEAALAYMRDIFLPLLPSLYARWERTLKHRPRSFLRLGSWIGGDRDGNWHWGAPRRPCWPIIWSACTRWARSCRFPASWPRSPKRWTGWPRKAATTIRRGAMSLTGVPSAAAMRDWRRLIRS